MIFPSPEATAENGASERAVFPAESGGGDAGDGVGATAMGSHTFDPGESGIEHPDWRKASLVAIGACVVVGLIESINDFLIQQFEVHPHGFLDSVRIQLPWWILWMLFMPAILWLARTHRFDTPRWRSSAAMHAGFAFIIALAHGSVYAAGFHVAYGGTATMPTASAAVRFFLVRYLMMDVLTYLAVAGIYYSFEYFSSFRHSADAAAASEARATRLQLSLARARIHALRMELNPHFLFNALNAIAGLVRRREIDPAIDMLARLGELLRTTLNRNMATEVALADELDLLRRYLDIELVRFGDRLRMVWEIDVETRAALVPPLILQPLVENALRHGISRRPGVAILRITARRAGTSLELIVRDTGEGLASLGGRPPREGIGLSNTRARLEELYGADETSLELADAAGGGARVRLLLPWRLARAEPGVAIGA